MCELLLKNILSNVLDTDLIIKWIKNENIEEEDLKLINDYELSQAEFVLYFLNYLHEETSGILQTYSSQGTPHRIKTPRRIESFSSKNSRKNSSRRTALFPDKNKSLNDPNLGVSHLENDFSQVTSTPRTNKNRHSLPQAISPISPIYKNKNSFSKSITPNRSSSSICLGDFLVKTNPVKKKTQKSSISKNDSSEPNIENCFNHSNITSFDSSCEFKNINKRRINPTNLSGEIFNSKRLTSTDSKNSFSFQTISETEISRNNISERDILLEERLKILSRPKPESEPLLLTPRRSQNLCSISPNLESVTFKPQLDILSNIYSILFDLNLILNPLSEIYFLISLLLLQAQKFESDKKLEELRAKLETSLGENNNENIFKSVHNCVYFSATVLSKQRNFLGVLDRASLKLLEENSRLRIFAPDLTKELVIYRGKKIEEKVDNYVINGGENVSFISDTDNRENFPSDSCFHTFRKQRDLFYDLLRTWENNHLQPGWNFSAAFSAKIRSLILMHSDPMNSVHLARLFKNQLLTEISQYDNEPLPPGLNNIDAGKLNRLRDRLVSKKNCEGPSPEPSFPGRQEFFKEFILVNSSPGFHRHLIDCFVSDIHLLDDIVFSFSDVDETEKVVDQGCRILYHNSLKSLKVLAKFLGFLETLPYKTDLPPNNHILESQIALRKHFTPSINVLNIVKQSLQNSKLILTIPWVADYLAMLDHITLRLPYFSELIEILFEVHYSCSKFLEKIEKILIIKLCLGWLFERPNFPLNCYQQWISKKYQICTDIVKKSVNDLSIDHLDLVDESVLFLCCPYLYEIRNFLSSDQSNSNFNKSAKYIRPISTTTDNSHTANKKLQKQLEDAFFHNQPSSTRKTIDLVSERVASACVKHICNNLVPNAKSKSLEIFQEHLKHVIYLDATEIQKELKLCCMKNAKELSDQCFEQFKKNIEEEISHCTFKRCEDSLKALLSEEIHPVTQKTCISIAVAQTTEKIQQWFDSHVNPGIFLKEFLTEMENARQGTSQNNKKITYKLPARGKNIDHDPEAKSPVKLLTDIREIMYIVHEKPENVTLENLEHIIEDSTLTCRKRCDLNPVAQFTICRMFYDMFFILATNRPDLTKEPSYLDNLITFWESYIHKSEKENFFDRIFCPRNACIFEKSIQPDKTWKACEILVIKLMRKKLLKPNNFEKQIMTMFKFEWQSNMKEFTKCLQNIVDDYVSCNGTQENFTFILSWIADYCNDEEFF